LNSRLLWKVWAETMLVAKKARRLIVSVRKVFIVLSFCAIDLTNLVCWYKYAPLGTPILGPFFKNCDVEKVIFINKKSANTDKISRNL
jgi:hypothetical protein